MIDYASLRAVAAVAETGSFEKAARQLNVTPSAVSQRVKHLEDRIGAALIVRGAPCVATEKGAWLCRHMQHVSLLEQDLFRELPGLEDGDRSSGRATVAVAVNADSLGSWFLPAAARFSERAGHLLAVTVDDQDHTAEWLKRGQVLAAVTSLAKPVSGCRALSLGALRYRATASPAFLARHFPSGVTAEALADAPSLTFNQKDLLQEQWAKVALGCKAGLSGHWLPSTQAFVDACLLGLGWGMNPDLLVRDHLKAGRLVELVPGAHLDIPLFWQINRMAADQLVQLTAAIAQAAKTCLEPAKSEI
ncbi:LysR family transcriptional regulator ArgP [Rhizobium sp. TRM95796]|uniref:LysR family transcriptional regulator ArgP n=1 Tax=Rhizobium sp. TRM95796 TaxID=2979862 RepID=UPI0021E87EE7|nr:LysR family transcriptional regulator ArgP [Rhizobium sp. TRM95796]MCV3764148.1 LysR family transcriptional regulator ArgP [Rhizobium sp. TRM95796]